jgi:putative salt-induced outer membrane protein
MQKFIYLIVFVLPLASWAKFKHESEASLNLTGGNTDLKTYLLRTANSFEYSINKWTAKGAYTYGESNKKRSAENWQIEGRYDLSFTDRFGMYAGELIESDRFSGIKRRYNSDLGGKFFFFKSKKGEGFVEAGYRYTVEENTQSEEDERKDSKGRVYLESHYQFKKWLKGKIWYEYLPNFSRSVDYQMSFGPSLKVALSSIFSLKTSYLWRYDNYPAIDKGKHDYTFLLTLMAEK